MAVVRWTDIRAGWTARKKTRWARNHVFPDHVTLPRTERVYSAPYSSSCLVRIVSVFSASLHLPRIKIVAFPQTGRPRIAWLIGRPVNTDRPAQINHHLPPAAHSPCQSGSVRESHCRSRDNYTVHRSFSYVFISPFTRSLYIIFILVAFALDVVYLTAIQSFSYISDIDVYRLRCRAACRQQPLVRLCFHFP